MQKNTKISSRGKTKSKNIKKKSDSDLILAKSSKMFKVKNLIDLKGKISFLPDYDYKKMRIDN